MWMRQSIGSWRGKHMKRREGGGEEREKEREKKSNDAAVHTHFFPHVAAASSAASSSSSSSSSAASSSLAIPASFSSQNLGNEHGYDSDGIVLSDFEEPDAFDGPELVAQSWSGASEEKERESVALPLVNSADSASSSSTSPSIVAPSSSITCSSSSSSASSSSSEPPAPSVQFVLPVARASSSTVITSSSSSSPMSSSATSSSSSPLSTPPELSSKRSAHEKEHEVKKFDPAIDASDAIEESEWERVEITPSFAQLEPRRVSSAPSRVVRSRPAFMSSSHRVPNKADGMLPLHQRRHQSSSSISSSSSSSPSATGSATTSPSSSSSNSSTRSFDTEQDLALRDWLIAHNFTTFVEAFLNETLCIDDLPFLSDHDLERLGMAVMGDRKRFMKAAKRTANELANAAASASSSPAAASATPASSSSSSSPSASAAAPFLPSASSFLTSSTSSTASTVSPSLDRLVEEDFENDFDERHGGALPSASYSMFSTDPPSSSSSSSSSFSSSSDVRRPSATRNLLHFSFLQSMPLRHSEMPGVSKNLDMARETVELQAALSETGKAYQASWEIATGDNLLKMMQYSRALHISGHGDPHALVLEDGKGELTSLSVETLSRILGLSGTKLKLVFVSACFSSRAAYAFVKAGVPHVIAVQEDVEVTDKNARAFARHVYLALGQGLTVKKAFEQGQAAVIAASPPCCCAHLHTAPDCSICEVCRSPQCCSVHAAPCHAPLEHKPASSSSSASESIALSPEDALDEDTVLPQRLSASASASRSHPHLSSSSSSSSSSAIAPTSRHCCQPSLAHDESLKFMLLPISGDHDVVLFEDDHMPPDGAWISRSPPKPLNNLPSSALDNFIGRAKDALQILPSILSYRINLITGLPGVGKSALAKFLAIYINDRRHFHATFLLRLKAASSVHEIDVRLAEVLRLDTGSGAAERGDDSPLQPSPQISASSSSSTSSQSSSPLTPSHSSPSSSALSSMSTSSSQSLGSSAASTFLLPSAASAPASFSLSSSTSSATLHSTPPSGNISTRSLLHSRILYELQRIKTENKKPFLFVLDDVDALLLDAASSNSFRAYLSQLLDSCDCHVVLTSTKQAGSIDGHTQRVHNLNRLHKLDLASLFVNRLPRALQAQDLKQHLKRVNSLQDLVAHPLFGLINGIPRLAEWCAELCNYTVVDEIYRLLNQAPILGAQPVPHLPPAVLENPSWSSGLKQEAKEVLRKCQALLVSCQLLSTLDSGYHNGFCATSLPIVISASSSSSSSASSSAAHSQSVNMPTASPAASQPASKYPAPSPGFTLLKAQSVTF